MLGAGGGEVGSQCSARTVSVWDNGRVLGTDGGGGGYPTLRMCFVPLNSAFKNSPNGNFYVIYTLLQFFLKMGIFRAWRRAGMAFQEAGPHCRSGDRLSHGREYEGSGREAEHGFLGVAVRAGKITPHPSQPTSPRW